MIGVAVAARDGHAGEDEDAAAAVAEALQDLGAAGFEEGGVEGGGHGHDPEMSDIFAQRN
jgi:hypothetical protein